MPYYSKEAIAEIKKMDLLTYLENYEPYELVKLSEGIYTTREHDSLKISNGLWFWWSRGFGGKSALKYLTEVRGMDFIDAVESTLLPTSLPMPTSIMGCSIVEVSVIGLYFALFCCFFI